MIIFQNVLWLTFHSFGESRTNCPESSVPQFNTGVPFWMAAIILHVMKTNVIGICPWEESDNCQSNGKSHSGHDLRLPVTDVSTPTLPAHATSRISYNLHRLLVWILCWFVYLWKAEAEHLLSQMFQDLTWCP